MIVRSSQGFGSGLTGHQERKHNVAQTAGDHYRDDDKHEDLADIVKPFGPVERRDQVEDAGHR